MFNLFRNYFYYYFNFLSSWEHIFKKKSKTDLICKNKLVLLPNKRHWKSNKIRFMTQTESCWCSDETKPILDFLFSFRWKTLWNFRNQGSLVELCLCSLQSTKSLISLRAREHLNLQFYWSMLWRSSYVRSLLI